MDRASGVNLAGYGLHSFVGFGDSDIFSSYDNSDEHLLMALGSGVSMYCYARHFHTSVKTTESKF